MQQDSLYCFYHVLAACMSSRVYLVRRFRICLQLQHHLFGIVKPRLVISGFLLVQVREVCGPLFHTYVFAS